MWQLYGWDQAVQGLQLACWHSEFLQGGAHHCSILTSSEGATPGLVADHSGPPQDPPHQKGFA